MFKLITYGLAAYGGYMLYQQYITKEISSNKTEDCSDPSLTFNQREMCRQRNNPGYIHAPLQVG